MLVASALAVTGALAFAAPASSHNYYTSSTPAIDAVLTTLPEQFVVTTNDNLLELGDSAGGFFMEVTGPDGLYYGDGCVTVAGASVSMAAAVGPVGKYSLEWQVISADGHTVAGQIPFTWRPLESTEPPAAGRTTPPQCGDVPEPLASETSEAPVTPTPTEDTDVASDKPASSQDAAAEFNNDILWIGGGIGIVAIAVIAAIILIRPKKKS